MLFRRYAGGRQMGMAKVMESEDELIKLAWGIWEQENAGKVWYDEVTPRELLKNMLGVTPETATEEDREDEAWDYLTRDVDRLECVTA